MTTYIHKMKCMTCGLHYAAFSWQDDWTPRSCPECGSMGGLLRWREESDQEIFEFVPGKAQLVEMNVG
jgi:DNA-directed RNA polymerase subunit RPC12/RpoP